MRSQFLCILLTCSSSEYFTLLAHLIVLTFVARWNYLFNKNDEVLIVDNCTRNLSCRRFQFNVNHIKEPIAQNASRLIYKVVEYAIRNKQPSQKVPLHSVKMILHHGFTLGRTSMKDHSQLNRLNLSIPFQVNWTSLDL